MRQLAVASCAVLILSVACAGDERAADTAARDAGAKRADASDPRDEEDAGRQDAAVQDATVKGELDLRSLLIAELIETESSLVARCSCLTASGVYESMSKCLDAVSLGRNWVDCANALDLSAQDSPEIRANLRCNIQELSQRSQCLLGSSCSDTDIAACMTATLNCAKLPLELLSQIAVQCHIAFSR
jgi:hypothetical protein